jgi:hypothetical protein
MRDRSEHVEDQLAGGRVGVDPFLQAEQSDAAPTSRLEPQRGYTMTAFSSSSEKVAYRTRIRSAAMPRTGDARFWWQL